MTARNKDKGRKGAAERYVRPAGYFKRYEIKARFGGTVRTMSIPMQSLRLTLKVFCYNLVH